MSAAAVRASAPAPAAAPERFGQALRQWREPWLRGFEGPAGQIALMHAELV